MSRKKGAKTIDDLRHNEYYGMQEVFDQLYLNSAKGEVFTDLTDIIFAEDNILLAYRNIKANGGSGTPGTDGFKNLVLVNVDVHKLIHAAKEETILHYLGILGLNVMQMRKVNYLRFELNLPVIKEYNPEEHKLTLKRIESYLDI